MPLLAVWSELPPTPGRFEAIRHARTGEPMVKNTPLCSGVAHQRWLSLACWQPRLTPRSAALPCLAAPSSMSLTALLPPPLPLARIAGGFFDAVEITEAFQQGLRIESAGTRYVVWVGLAAALVVGGLVCWWKGVDKRLSPAFGKSLHLAATLIFFGLFAAVVMIPSLACEGARVTPELLRVRSGMWFAPRVQEVRLADVVRIEEGQVRPATGKSRSLITLWYFQTKDGRWERVPLPKFVATHREAMVRYLARHGRTVVVVNTGE